MGKKVIFCQSSADIYYSLALYNQFKNEFEVEIYTLNNIKNYQFIQSLGLQCKLNHISYPSKRWYRVLQLLLLRWRNHCFFKKHFQGTDQADFYFFSPYFDYVLFYFLNKLEPKNQGFLVDHYTLKGTEYKQMPFKKKVGRIIYSFVAGKQIGYEILNSHPVLYYGKTLNLLDPKQFEVDLSQYKKNFVPQGQKAILIFESDEGSHLFSRQQASYQELITKVVQFAQGNGYVVWVKPHPRLGYSGFLNQLGVKIIDDTVPGEFIEYQDFFLVLGNISKVLANLTEKNSEARIFSLIDLLPFDTENSREYYRSFLLRSSNQKLRWLRSFDELIHLLPKC